MFWRTGNRVKSLIIYTKIQLKKKKNLFNTPNDFELTLNSNQG